nr:hypothetical protein [uncultured Methanoregula sp.]
MTEQPDSGNRQVTDAIFALAFHDRRSPIPRETWSSGEFLAGVLNRVPGASREECRAAIARVGNLSETAYEIGESFRAGRFGATPEARLRAVQELSQKNPGFSGSEYEEAFAAGLRWTAF